MKTAPIHFETVHFLGDTIENARINGEGYSSIKRMCENLGVSLPAQLAKLKKCKWAGVAIIAIPDERGCMQPHAMLPIDSVPMWLATIHPSKVAFAVRAKLEAYQMEVNAVLAAWFNGPREERLLRMADLDREIESLRGLVIELREDVENAGTFMRYERKKRLELTAERDAAKASMDKVTRPFQEDGGEYLSVRDFCTQYGVLDENGKRMPARRYSAIGKRLTAISNHARVPIHFDGSPWAGKVTNAYRMDVLVAWRIDLDFRNRVTTKTYAKFHQPRLFAC